ncbi:MAG: hypothetical protein J7576_18640 [Siphonobacter aquaeclarae]|nr:hypothetical protein [Siphonobacter aquaeclarae]
MWTLPQVKAKIQEKIRAATRQMKITSGDLADVLDASAEYVDEQVTAMNLQTQRIVTVPTYAAAEAQFSGPRPLKVNVIADEAYNNGETSFYTYTPGLGVAQWGLDYTYKN